MHNILEETTNCVHCHLGPMCQSDINSDQVNTEVNLAIKKKHHLRRRDHLTLPKNAFKNLYVVQSGAIKTTQIDLNGEEIVRGFYFTGEIFGFEAIYSNHYDFSPIALTDSIICEIPYSSFLNTMQKRNSIELQKYLLYLVSQQLNRGNYLTSTTAEQRIAAFIIDISARIYPPKRQQRFIVPMTRYDIGNYLNLTSETVSRIFTQMRKNGLIEIQHKVMNILQPEQIKLLAGFEV